MKKILLFLFFTAASMGITQLSAYCFYNHSKTKKITIRTFSITKKGNLIPKATYKLRPGGSSRCRNWKDIDKKNRKKEWYWKAYSGFKAVIPWYTLSERKRFGEGYFPIGGAVYFSGWYKGKFGISYDGKEWEYRKPPWNHRSKPWRP